MNKKELETIEKEFIIPPIKNIEKEILQILVLRGVKFLNDGFPLTLGDFESLSPRKKSKIHTIGDKMFKFIKEDRKLLNYSDLFAIERLNKEVKDKHDALNVKDEEKE